MKRFITVVVLSVLLALPGFAFASGQIFGAYALIGGTAGCLDAINHLDPNPNITTDKALSDGDIALVGVTSGSTGTYYVYVYDADSGTAESSPTIIKPDSNSGNGRWYLSSQYATTFAAPQGASGQSVQLLEATGGSNYFLLQAFDALSYNHICKPPDVDETTTLAVLHNGTAGNDYLTETEFIPVAYMDEDGTNPPAAKSTYSTASNSREYVVRNFDGATDEDLTFVWIAPHDIAGTTIKVRWIGIVTQTTGPSTSTISFQVQGISLADTEDGGFASYGSAVALTKSSFSAAQDDVLMSAFAEVTPTSLGKGELVHIRVNRDADGADTYAYDFGLIGLEIKYKRTLDNNF